MSENNGKQKHTPEATFQMRLAAERALLNGAAFSVPVLMGLAPVVAVCGLVQLALRHPGTVGTPAAKLGRAFIDGMMEALKAGGFVEHAELVRKGDDPKQDQPAAAPAGTMEPAVVFRNCAACGSAEDVLATATTCPGCGTPYVQA